MELTLHLLHIHILVISVVFVSGCFITNCPPGGKRSGSEEKSHQCEQCGPPGMGGRCFGPQICCSTQFGCLVGTSVTAVCQQEAHSPSLCHNQAASCDGSAETGPINGQCAAVGICCTPETCTLDEDCSVATIMESGNGHLLKHEAVSIQRLSDDPEHALSMVHGPLGAWSYRRLIQSKKMKNSAEGKISAEPESITFFSTSGVPQGPSHYPPGPVRQGDYF